MDGCDGCTIGMHSMLPHGPLKRVKMVNFMLFVFYHESSNNKEFNSSKRHGVKKYTEQPERRHRNSTRNKNIQNDKEGDTDKPGSYGGH